jgi:hypothetical protein
MAVLSRQWHRAWAVALLRPAFSDGAFGWAAGFSPVSRPGGDIAVGYGWIFFDMAEQECLVHPWAALSWTGERLRPPRKRQARESRFSWS